MYAITATIRKSRKEGMPGYIIFRLRDHSGAERLFASGIQSTEDELTTVHKETVMRGLKSLYDVIERLHDGGNPYGIDDIAAEFRNVLANGIAGVDISDFRVNREIASVGSPFNKWIDTFRPHEERYLVGSDLTIHNLTGFVSHLLSADDVSSRSGTINNYKSVRSTLSEFIGTLPECREIIDGVFVGDFHKWLKKQNLTVTTVSFYLRMLRAVLNKAKEKGILQMSANWFSGIIGRYSLDEDKAKAKVLDRTEINKIVGMDIEANTLTDLSRDLFMFSFYCRGMELFDILNLKPESIHGDLIVYNKRLTGKQQVIKLELQARKIIDKYINDSESCIFSAVTKYTKSREYNTIRRVITPNLAKMGQMLDLKTPLVFSVARNTWTELAKESNLTSLILS